VQASYVQIATQNCFKIIIYSSLEFCTGTVTVNIPRITAEKPAVTESQICKNPAVTTVTGSNVGIKICGKPAGAVRFSECNPGESLGLFGAASLYNSVAFVQRACLAYFMSHDIQ